jgi:hypothetical protein
MNRIMPPALEQFVMRASAITHDRRAGACTESADLGGSLGRTARSGWESRVENFASRDAASVTRGIPSSPLHDL